MHKTDVLPADTFAIAHSLGLRLKNSIECKQDFKENFPLIDRNACIARYKGEYTVYYDERNTYKNFSIAHEISHYILGHTSEGAEQNHDADLMAAIIVAPFKLICKYNIKSATQLSEWCRIPVAIAELYWNEIRYDTRIPFNGVLKRPIAKFSLIGIIVVMMVSIGCLFAFKPRKTENFPPTDTSQIVSTATPTPSPATQEPETNAQTVYITPSGGKYHVAGCRHIRGSETVEMTVEEAVELGKEPCKDCIG